MESNHNNEDNDINNANDTSDMRLFNHISAIIPYYTNNREYRLCIRLMFNMSCDEVTEYDDESNDELAYDMNSMSRGMDLIYDRIKSDELFQKVFMKAAGKMLSEDPNIGFSILFSYDYLAHFHACLCTYLNTPELFNKDYITYKTLYTSL